MVKRRMAARYQHVLDSIRKGIFAGALRLLNDLIDQLSPLRLMEAYETANGDQN
jgi:hypothetical protein